MFREKTDGNHEVEFTADTHVKKEVAKHHPIRIRPRDSAMLFVSNIWNCCVPKRVWPKKEKYKSMYKKVEEKLEDMLDITKIIKNITNSKIMLAQLREGENIKPRLKHHEKYLVDLEDELSSSQSSISSVSDWQETQ